MKNVQLLAITVLILLFVRSNSIRLKSQQVQADWASVTTNKIDSNTNVKVYYPKAKFSSSNLDTLLGQLPSKDFKLADSDIFVVNTEGIFWFLNKNAADKRTAQISGGCLGGIWELTKTQGSGNTVTYSLRTENGKANLLFNDFGMGIGGQYSNGNGGSNSKINWGLLDSRDAKETSNSGKALKATDGGLYADNGLLIEFKGSVTNNLAVANNNSISQTAKVDEFSSNTDTDPSTDNGSATFTLTYRVPLDKPELSFLTSVNPVQGKMPISQAGVQLNYNGKVQSVSALNPDNKVDVAYEAVAAPELMIGNADTSLANVDVNKYFTNSCVKSLFNYEFKDTKKAFAVKTPSGRGQVLCLGAPIYKISFVCAYPNNDNLPKEAYEDYVLYLREQKTSTTERKITLDYTLLRLRTLNLDSSSSVTFGMRLKFIDATPALA